MGIDIDRTEFNDKDRRLFQHRLKQQLATFKTLLTEPNFGQSQRALGAELELYLVDQHGRPLACNEDILSLANNPLLSPELNSYNLEYNLQPCPLHQQPFIHLEKAMADELATLNRIGQQLNCRALPIGILPTLVPDDFGPHCMTQRKRYQALVNAMIRQRGSDFRIDINGRDPLQFQLHDITLEGANTSLQIHYPVAVDEFARLYNAMQMFTPLALAVGANSPTLFGHQLWEETRIPLFKQSIDTRHIDRYQWNAPARVNFGHGWLRKGIYELVSETVQLYPPLLPLCKAEQTTEEDCTPHDGLPPLDELQLHMGTVWLWNRPIYDCRDCGHLRIEIRALPSGPSAIDMMANAAFLIGLAEGIKDDVDTLLPALPFQTAEYNFYRAAQFGLQAELIWPNHDGGYTQKSVLIILQESLSLAQAGLENIGIGREEIDRYLSVIEDRIRYECTGASWQRQCIDQLSKTMNKSQALHAMLEQFIEHSHHNLPVAEWPQGRSSP